MTRYLTLSDKDWTELYEVLMMHRTNKREERAKGAKDVPDAYLDYLSELMETVRTARTEDELGEARALAAKYRDALDDIAGLIQADRWDVEGDVKRILRRLGWLRQTTLTHVMVLVEHGEDGEVRSTYVDENWSGVHGECERAEGVFLVDDEEWSAGDQPYDNRRQEALDHLRQRYGITLP